MPLHQLWDKLPFLGRLLITASTALLIAGAAMIYLSAGREAAEIRQDMQTELKSELELLPGALAETVAIGDFATVQQMLDRYVARPLIAEVFFRDTSGTLLHSEDRPHAMRAPDWFVAMFDFSDLNGQTVVVIGGREYGQLFIRMTAQEPANRAWEHLQNHLSVLVLAILIDFFGIWLVLRHGLRPLDTLHRGVGLLADGRRDVRLTVHGSPELRDVLNAFNRMAAELARSEQERQAQADLIATQHQRLRYIVDGTGVGTWEWHVQQGELVCNERWAEMIGYTLAELAPLSIHTWNRLVHPDDLKRSEAQLVRHFAREVPYYEQEVRMRHKAGHWVWILDRGGVSTWSASGHPRLMSGTHQDISERKQNEAHLRAAKQAAEAANVAKSRFLATMSHEIRTPLNGVLGMAQLLLTPDLPESDRTDYARIILGSGQTLLTLLNDILDLSRVESGKLKLEASPFEPQALLDEVRALYLANARDKQLALEARWQGERGIRYLADSYRLRQMLSNFITNALKFTGQGRISMDAREIGMAVAEAEQDGTGDAQPAHPSGEAAPQRVMLEFAVTDTGIGIPADKHQLLFRAFSQADSSTTRQYGGTGLGLAIVAHLARLMGGEVGMSSTVGQGSRFWFRMVAERLPAGAAGQMAGAGQGGSRLSACFRGRVLLVEDNPLNQKVTRLLLQNLGLETLLAEDGAQAVNLLTGGETVDLVLMDVQMPVLDGYMATAHIRAWEAAQGRPPLPVIALTAEVFPEDQQRCLDVGMNAYLAKPVAIAELVDALKCWLPAPLRNPPPAAAIGSTGAADAAIPAPEQRADSQEKPDIPAFLAEAERLQALFATGQFDALKRFETLAATVRGSTICNDMEPIRDALHNFRFAAASEQLAHLCNRLKGPAA